METDFRSMFAAPVIANEKVRDNRREAVTLEHTVSVAQLIRALIQLLR
ncbi:MAG: hypothetical protein MUF84_09880 [Anaerolineae bacterium]|jgi:hypothetical protein|nr:hypothetical protein [Anaerolineae bacterium]